MHSYDVNTGKIVNFSNKMNELFPLLSRSNEMADLILVEHLYKDDRIKSTIDKAAKHLQRCLYRLSSLPDMLFYWNEHA